MQRQRQAGGSNDPFGGQKQNDLEIKPLGVQIPDVHETMRLAGVQDAKVDDRRKRLLCCCGVSGCGIGPMTQVEDVA